MQILFFRSFTDYQTQTFIIVVVTYLLLVTSQWVVSETTAGQGRECHQDWQLLVASTEDRRDKCGKSSYTARNIPSGLITEPSCHGSDTVGHLARECGHSAFLLPFSMRQYQT